jgi:hypothetical protein
VINMMLTALTRTSEARESIPRGMTPIPAGGPAE